ncbi:MAG: MFS transporter, partial [Arcobacteraceae bacterium]|nr:MFS transporter [Arcobacteraceae bacterium]
IIFFGISYLTIGLSSSDIIFVLGVVIFFIGFNMHEPIMQSLATKFAKVHQRGMVLGIFNSFGYFGTFLGGLLGGIFFNKASLSAIVITIAVVCVLWIILIAFMPNPMKKQVAYIGLDNIDKNNCTRLNEKGFIDEWYINENENLLIVKYNTNDINQEQLEELLK